jgi:hypothetical protein
MDYFAGNDSQPTCQFEGRYFSTFDNVVARFNPAATKGCYHLLTADCSGEHTMAISAKNLGTQDIKLKIVLSGAKITVGKQQSGQGIVRLIKATQTRALTVSVNGKEVELPYTVREQNQRSKSNDFVARIRDMPNGGVQIETRRQQIAFDAERVVIYGSETYRNVTCGMCGDFDGEKVADLRSPSDFPLSSGTLAYAAYAYNSKSDSETCHVEPAVRQLIKQEESIGQQDRRRSSWSKSYRRNGSNKLQKSSSSSSSSSSESNESNSKSSENKPRQAGKPNSHQQVRKLESENKVCIAEEIVKCCPYGYKPVGGQSRQVKFTCFRKASTIAQEVQQKVQQQLQQSKAKLVDLSQSRFKTVGERQSFHVQERPTKCVRSY